MRNFFRSAIIASMFVSLSGCGIFQSSDRNEGFHPGAPARATGKYPGSNRQPAGFTYRVRGKTYRVMGWHHAQGYDEKGIASWYGREGGSRTATGERYFPMGMTAAHKTLPLNSLIRVTNLRNGHSVVLRVNDRGPFAKGRVVDVSKAAANQLGFRSQGLTPARVEFLGPA